MDMPMDMIKELKIMRTFEDNKKDYMIICLQNLIINNSGKDGYQSIDLSELKKCSVSLIQKIYQCIDVLIEENYIEVDAEVDPTEEYEGGFNAGVKQARQDLVRGMFQEYLAAKDSLEKLGSKINYLKTW